VIIPSTLIVVVALNHLLLLPMATACVDGECLRLVRAAANTLTASMAVSISSSVPKDWLGILTYGAVIGPISFLPATLKSIWDSNALPLIPAAFTEIPDILIRRIVLDSLFALTV